MTIIGLSGKARSGKDFIADKCCELYGWRKMKLADPLKKTCREVFGLSIDQTDGAEKEKYRNVMIGLGLLGRTVNPNFWVDRLKEEILKTPQAQLGTYVVADVRFINEAEWIKRHGGILVRLERAVELRGEDINDPSETELDDYKGFDLRILESSNVDAGDVPGICESIREAVEIKSASPFFNK